MSRCRTLIQENQELGNQLSVGNLKSLEAKVQLQEKQNQQLMKAQADTDDLVLQLDEEVEGFQANIMSLQAKLEKAKKRIKELEGEIAGQKQDPDKKDENKDDAPVYYTPEQLSEYYDKLIGAGYMTKEQADQALEQAKSQINEEGLVPVTFAQSQKGDEVKAEPK